MSAKLAGDVWELDLTGSKRDVLLVYADHANEDHLAWPGVALVAWKVGVSERQVQRVLRSLVTDGLLKIAGREKGGRRSAVDGATTIYQVCLEAGQRKPPRPAPKGDTQMSLLLRRPKAPRVTSDAPKGDGSGSKGDTQMSPEPSFEEPVEPSVPDRALAKASGRGRRVENSGSKVEKPRCPNGAAHQLTDSARGYLLSHWRKLHYRPDGKPPEGYHVGRDVEALKLLVEFNHYTPQQLADAAEGLALMRAAGDLQGIRPCDKITARFLLGTERDGRPLVLVAEEYFHASLKRRPAPIPSTSGFASIGAALADALAPP